ncbi:hypothetical protein SISNIDRAFT_296547 [Sistotremastrum niveocremeum HHB9708]|uniref:Uncharacterized protein n=2 Tax=Sistotremastraceae TaxID=3402574 RepID=A0A164NLD3_9AGAM|nr:hypothetical protein SISNIDRAFT_296547 [Sistotremastrum niveocremeum HHB9708]KZT41955.1 hypothetical protein SISSUDRAFT_180936 [Sistotremastrum suecicum HHB10207 ss-3]
MDRVPPEIISKIFVHHADNLDPPPDRLQRLSIWNVCKEWRTIALQTPFLVTALLDLSLPKVKIRSIIQENPVSYYKVRMPGVMFRPNIEEAVVASAGQTIREVQDRITKLEIDWIALANRMPLAEFSAEFLGSLKAPKLRFLRLSHTIIGNVVAPEISLESNVTEKLSYLEVQLIYWRPPLHQLPNLTTLKLGLAKGTSSYDLASLMTTLRACPRLQYFNLMGRALRGAFSTDSLVPIPPVQLPDLQELTIAYFKPRQIDEILGSIQVNPSTRISVWCIRLTPDDEVKYPQALLASLEEASTCRVLANEHLHINELTPYMEISYSAEDGPTHSLTFGYLQTVHLNDPHHVMHALDSLPLISLTSLDFSSVKLPSGEAWKEFLLGRPELTHIGVHGGRGGELISVLRPSDKDPLLCPNLRSLDLGGNLRFPTGAKVLLTSLNGLINFRRHELVPIHQLTLSIYDSESNTRENRVANLIDPHPSEVTLDIIRRLREAKNELDTSMRQIGFSREPGALHSAFNPNRKFPDESDDSSDSYMT